jgi:hypothetical protein
MKCLLVSNVSCQSFVCTHIGSRVKIFGIRISCIIEKHEVAAALNGSLNRRNSLTTTICLNTNCTILPHAMIALFFGRCTYCYFMLLADRWKPLLKHFFVTSVAPQKSSCATSGKVTHVLVHVPHGPSVEVLEFLPNRVSIGDQHFQCIPKRLTCICLVVHIIRKRSACVMLI